MINEPCSPDTQVCTLTYVKETVNDAPSDRREQTLVKVGTEQPGFGIENDSQRGKHDERVDVEDDEPVQEDVEQGATCAGAPRARQGHVTALVKFVTSGY